MTSSNSWPKVAAVARGLAGTAASLVLFSAATAAADPAFPEMVEKDLGMPCLPTCTICHIDTKGGFNTLRNTTNGHPGFGKVLHSDEYGEDKLIVQDFNTLPKALARNDADNSDVDLDGTPDIEELKKCEDPNDPTPGASLQATGPEFGCVRVARQGPIDDVGLVSAAAVLALGIAALRRRRAR